MGDVLPLFPDPVGAVLLRRPAPRVVVRLKAGDMAEPGWLERLCRSRLADLGPVALQVFDDAGAAVCYVGDVGEAARVGAEPVPVVAEGWLL